MITCNIWDSNKEHGTKTGTNKNQCPKANQRSVLSFFFGDFLHVLQVSGPRSAQIETLSSVPALESWEKIHNLMNHCNQSIFMTNDSMFLISCWLCWATSDFLSPFGDFDAFQKPLSVVLLKAKVIHKKDLLENMILVTACMSTSTYFHAFPPSKTLFGRPEATLRQASFQGLKSVSFHNVWSSSKGQIYNYAYTAQYSDSWS